MLYGAPITASVLEYRVNQPQQALSVVNVSRGTSVTLTGLRSFQPQAITMLAGLGIKIKLRKKTVMMAPWIALGMVTQLIALVMEVRYIPRQPSRQLVVHQVFHRLAHQLLLRLRVVVVRLVRALVTLRLAARLAQVLVLAHRPAALAVLSATSHHRTFRVFA